MENPLSDQELIRKISEENQELYTDLVRRYEKPLFYYLCRLTGRAHDCEDILQEVFIKAFINLRTFDLKRKFSSWLYRIAHNEAINYLKKHKSEISLEEYNLSDILPDKKDLVEELVNAQDRQKITKAVYKLDFKYREILILRYFEDKSYEEISDILRKPVNTVGTLITRAKKQLKEKI